MKKGRIKVVFLALIIIMPLVFTTIITISSDNPICELAEVSSEEEEKNKEEREVDSLDEFLIHNPTISILSEVKNLRFLEKKASENPINREVLTPPPEFV